MNHRHQLSTTAADGLQLGSGLRRIVCLAALLFIFVAGVRAANYVITIYDGCKLKNSDLDAINVLGILGQVGWSGSGNVRTLFTLNPQTELFDFNQSTLVCSVPKTITPANDITFPVAAYRVMFEQAYPGLYYITLYDNIVVQFQVAVNEQNFPDTNFRNWVKAQSYGSDGILTKAEIAKIKQLDVSGRSISDLTGIEYFTALISLLCYNNNINEANMTKLVRSLPTGTYMRDLWVYKDGSSAEKNFFNLEHLNRAKDRNWGAMLFVGDTPAKFTDYVIYANFPDENFRSYVSTNFDKNGDGWLLPSEIAAVTKIDVSNEGISSLKGIEYFTALTDLDCSYNGLTELDVSKNTALTKLNCEDSQLASLNVSGCTALTDLKCGWNQLTSLDVSKNTALIELYCYGNQLTTLDVSGCTALTTLDCYINELTFLNVSGCTALTELYCSNNQQTTLDVSGCTALTWLSCVNNQLTSLDVTSCTALRLLYCYKNQIRGQGMTDLINSLPDRRSASVEGQLMVYKDETPAGILMTPKQVEVATSKNWSVLRYDVDIRDWVAYEGEPADGIEISEENFPDENFREYVGSKTIDKDEDGYLSDEEIAAATRIYVYDKSISSLKGIEYFTALKELNCQYNNLTTLDVSGCTALEELNCHGNQLTTLDVSNNTALTELHCDYNGLTELDVSNSTALTWLSCVNNQMTSLDVTNCTALTKLNCQENRLKSLDVSGCTALKELYCHSNLIRGKGMTDLVKSLPDRRSASEGGELQVNWDETPAGNLMTPGQVEIAKSMNWSANKYHFGVGMWVPYGGETVPGDATGDGEVDALDVDCLRDYVLGLDPQPFSFESADMNANGVVDIQDLTQLIEILLKR